MTRNVESPLVNKASSLSVTPRSRYVLPHYCRLVFDMRFIAFAPCNFFYMCKFNMALNKNNMAKEQFCRPGE
ncbi:MAG: hypothetical protein LBH04_02130 [Tannerellaceae bacterium]|jgi:hypothetical protein|nr:hypothetical protein [Tannerellaceae bacterium]